jgi:preprotein translocase subunit SecG
VFVSPVVAWAVVVVGVVFAVTVVVFVLVEPPQPDAAMSVTVVSASMVVRADSI